MKSLAQWLTEYGESHRNPRNQIIHEICVPIIFLSITGFLIWIPVQVGPIHIGEIVIIAALLWYMTLGLQIFMIMFLEAALVYFLMYELRQFIDPWPVLLTIFVVGWVGQFIGHKIEGKKPSFFKDLQFLLIGPLWVLRKFLVKL